MTTRAFLYARQSLARDDDTAAVDRQLAACRQLAESRGWEVVGTFVDNNRSASTGKERPEFDRMMRAVRAGGTEVVVVWHLDRLTRRLADLSGVMEACKASGCRIATVQGDLDLSTDVGEMLAGILVSVAQAEVRRKGTRQRAANRQRAEQGKTTWTRRPFGYDRDASGDVVVIEPEAEALRAAAARVLAGEPLAAVARTMPVPTSTGGPWNVTGLRRALLNPRCRGEVRYRGELLSDQLGPAILDADVQETLGTVLRDPKRRKAPDTARRWLLSGLLVCGVDGCGKRMHAQPGASRGRRYMTYRCPERHLQRHLELVDEVVVGTVLARLRRPDALALLAPEVDVTALRQQAVDLRRRRDAIAGLLGDGLIGPEAAREQARRLTDQLRTVEAQVAAATWTSPAAALAAEEDVHTAWERLTVRQRADVVDVLAVVRLLPAGRGGRFDPEHVVIEWRSA